MTFYYSMTNPFPQVLNLAGTGLNNGYVYIGMPGQDPEIYPKQVYWDDAGLIPAAQPLPTTGGYIYRSGTPSAVYLNGAYSIRVRDKNGSEIYYQANVLDEVLQYVADLQDPNGSNLIGFIQAGVGAVTRTAQSKMRDIVHVEDFGATGNGVTDDAAAILKALDALPSSGGTLLFGNGKRYLIGSPLFTGNKDHIALEGNGSTLLRDFDGPTTEANLLEFILCDLVVVKNLDVFGDNETHGGHEAQKHNIATYGCKRILFENVSATYGICDGFYTDYFLAGITRHGITSLQTVMTEHITFINCDADYNYRNGHGGIVASTILGLNSSFSNTGRSSAGGTSPMAGVDLESNVGGNYTPNHATYMGCRYINNAGGGLLFDYRSSGLEVINCLIEGNGSNGLRSYAPKVVARSCTFRSNGTGASGVQRAQVQSIDATTTNKTPASWHLDSCIFENAIWGDFQCSEGVGVRFSRCSFLGGANFAIRVAASATTRPLQGAIVIEDVLIAGKTSDAPPGSVAYVMLGSLQVPITIKNLTLNQQIVKLGNTSDGSASVTGIQNTNALRVGMGVSGSGISGGTTITAIDVNGSTITLSAAASGTASNVTLEFSSATPVTSGLTLGTPTDLQSVVGVDFRGTGWVTKQDGGMLRASYIANNKDDGVVNAAYNLVGSATYDPPSLNDGDGATTTVTVTGAALGDYANASFSVALAGVTVTAWVSTPNTVSVRFQNETGGTVDLASGTLRARVWKA
ncbi:glycosyl hydrolase family 28-related protein [Rhizorhabdus histidinilytica]|uniref:glycosyl hydrolase family 28-related protein n=1 Tax=Rhizorhabdus histidinilytica TaxID=439228 RepID=UPI00321FC7E8